MLLPLASVAQGFGDIREALQRSSLSQLQEKVYVHTDNQCYFVGDTLWYKAYVVRADSLSPSPLSRILYVELLSPDGLLVERQQVVVAARGLSCGQIVLSDSLFAGYYELRAYTRWMLNFGARPMKFSKWDGWAFYNNQMATDFYTQYDGLFSRVFPIYNKPEEQGDFSYKGMQQRPYQRLPKEPKEELHVTFYPEGGTLVEGQPSRIAFEVTDQHGEAQEVRGSVSGDAAGHPVRLSTEFMGRGSFSFTPGKSRGEATIFWKGKQHRFHLPQAEEKGVTLQLDDDGQLHLASNLDEQLAVSVLCRGALRHFSRVNPKADGTALLRLPIDELPAGVADVTVFTKEGRIVADRLFFVSHPQATADTISLAAPLKHTYQPYEPINLQLQLPRGTEGSTFSIAVRDARTDEPSFYDGNVMTDLLLSSELRGFVAYPAHYFEADDAQHRRHLDLLMLVQGWRRYSWQQHVSPATRLRYAPEREFVIEGTVYPMLDVGDAEPKEVLAWQNGRGLMSSEADEADSTNIGVYGKIGEANAHLGVNHKGLKREVMVEAEIALGNQQGNGQEVFGSTAMTVEQGHFKFSLPPYYGLAYINIKAYNPKDSLKKGMTSHRDRHLLDEDRWPDYYVKRDLFFPAQALPYDYYQKNQPDIELPALSEEQSELSMENDSHRLRTVTVKGRRMGKRKIDYTSPVYQRDAYDVYNELTDRGLSWGKLDMRQFPVQVARLLYGNMGRQNRMFNVDGMIDRFIYYRNYTPAHTFYVPQLNTDAPLAANGNRFSPQELWETLKLRRLKDVRVYSDYEPRNPDSLTTTSVYAADATVEMLPFANGAKQFTFRDRHIRLQGFNEPAQFYQPDYSRRSTGQQPADYRRTLYWNPNAVADAEGRYQVTIYNNGRQTRLHLSAAGVTPRGRLLHMEQ